MFSFGPVADGPATVGWDVRFAVLAALCAMFGLLAKQSPLPLVTAVLATMGFLDALSSMLAGTDRVWAMTVIVLLNALQAVAAAAALLLAPNAAAEPADPGGYEAYVDYYNQAVRNYYNRQGSRCRRSSRSAPGTVTRTPTGAPPRGRRAANGLLSKAITPI